MVRVELGVRFEEGWHESGFGDLHLWKLLVSVGSVHEDGFLDLLVGDLPSFDGFIVGGKNVEIVTLRTKPLDLIDTFFDLCGFKVVEFFDMGLEFSEVLVFVVDTLLTASIGSVEDDETSGSVSQREITTC